MAVTGKKIFLDENIPMTPLRNITGQQHLIQDCCLMKPLSKSEADFPLAYVMVTHKDLNPLERLFRAVYRPHNVHCVHADEKATLASRDAAGGLLSGFASVFPASRREPVVYAGISRLQADLNYLRDLAASQAPWKSL